MDDIGTRLQELRKNKNVSVEEVAEQTKIRPHIIKSIEAGNYSILPNVYIKSFIRTYAEYLDIPTGEIDEHLNDIFGKAKPAAKDKPENTELKQENKSDLQLDRESLRKKVKKAGMRKETQAKIINYLIYLALGIAAVALLYFALFSDGSDSSNGELTEVPADTAVVEKGNDLLSFFENEPDSLILEAKASDSSWLNIEIDNKSSEQYLMTPGEEKRWAAGEFFIITMGNVGAVEFRRNGQLLKSFGKKGSVVRNLKITKDTVINPGAGWNTQDSLRRARYKNTKKKETPTLIEPSELPKKPLRKKENKEGKN